MQRANRLLKISAITDLLFALFTIPYEYTKGFGLILLVMGILLLSYSFLPNDELKNKKGILIIIAIISLVTNAISSIFLFLVFDELSSAKSDNENSPPAVSNMVTSESKRIDLLLKLGLGMILVSGVLFATTSWEIISNTVKVIALILMGIMFLGLSSFSEKRLKIKSTTKAYYILGLAFFLLTWIGIGYFGVISEWFSYSGEGKNLVYFITLSLLSLMLYLIGYKFSEKENTYMGHTCVYLSFYHFLAFFNLTLAQIISILSVISLSINLINSKKIQSLKDINYIASYLYWSILLTQGLSSPTIVVIIGSIINVINLSYLSFKSNNSLEKCASIIISYILILISTLNISFNINKYIIYFICTTLYSLFIRYNKKYKDKYEVTVNQIVYNASSTILLWCISLVSPIKTLLIATIYFGINLLNSKNPTDYNCQVDFRYQPVVIYILMLSIINLVNSKVMIFDYIIANALAILVYTVISHFSVQKTVKKYYKYALNTLSILTLLVNYTVCDNTTAIVLLASSIYLFFTRNKEVISEKVLYYIFVLINISMVIQTINILYIPQVVASIVVLMIYGILTCTISDKNLKTVNYISLVVPMYQIIELISVEESIKVIIINAFYLYILYLIVRLIINDKESKDIIATIGLALILFERLVIGDLYSGLYIGIVCIITIFITFINNEYKKLFYCSATITVLNIIIQLWDYWAQIPFWLYLLVVGIAIIGFVTYKEVKKKDEPVQPTQIDTQPLQSIPSQNINEEETEILMDTKIINFCPTCGKKNNGGNFCGGCGTNLRINK